MEIDYELVEKIGATHYAECGYFYKIHEGVLLCYSIDKKWNQSIRSFECVKPIPPKQQPESDYDRGMRKAMQAIAKSCGKIFGSDIGYEDLPALVESLVNPPKPKPPVRVEYEKVADSIFDLKDEFERGELCWKQRALSSGILVDIDSEKQLIEGFLDENLYRRIEKPVDWRDEVIKYLKSKGYLMSRVPINTTLTMPIEINQNFVGEEFLEMCQVALRANGEL